MGYASYEITRNDGKTIQAGYAITATCEQDGCTEQIDRGLAYLCGQLPGGDEHGCGGYFCAKHLTADQKCQPCDETATEANTWTNPDTGEEYDLRDEYLPNGERYQPDGWVWKHLGTFRDGVPVLVPVKLPERRPGGHSGSLITEFDFEAAGVVAYRQQLADKTAS